MLRSAARHEAGGCIVDHDVGGRVELARVVEIEPAVEAGQLYRVTSPAERMHQLGA